MSYFKPLIINQVTELTWLTMTCVCLLQVGFEKNSCFFADAYQG